ncbi:uncharacterized protein LOC127239301 [Andrographis paniculata]|uniref:uncharacterized protein LOC127239301 n=1 Tax=Andrographis paniculata TaxID=175694 RepID=UPI0021E8028C|nr:uncharacterized protein LOC127239301 [Andrographis paniculata]
MAGLCASHSAVRVRVRVHSRARVRSPFHPCNVKAATGSKLVEEKSELSKNFFFTNSLTAEAEESGNTVMVVVDSTSESKGSLEWALSHAVQTPRDTILLFHVAKQDGKSRVEIRQKAYDILRSTKNTCQLKRPEVRVEMAYREGKEKGATIVEEANRLGVSLLVLGHRKQSFLRLVQTIWTNKKSRINRVVDHCIQNAKCMTIAVRRKNSKYGGYLITTKRHKNFWLLA